MSARSQLQSFTIDNLPTLDVAVDGALELFVDEGVSQNEVTNLVSFEKPLVIASAGALATAKILFADRTALFADESNFELYLNNFTDIDGVVVVSASGSKHALPISKTLKEKQIINKRLLTATENSPAAKYFEDDEVLVTKKNREPYTYNTSTYLGMILAATNESAKDIQDFLEEVKRIHPRFDFSQYSAFVFIVPSTYGALAQLVRIKFEELYGPYVSGRAYTSEDIKHAKTVVTSGEELFISLGVENDTFGLSKNRLEVPVPKELNAGALMALSYYLVGSIQRSQPDYFSQHIKQYAKQMSETFGVTIEPIVE